MKSEKKIIKNQSENNEKRKKEKNKNNSQNETVKFFLIFS